MLQMGEKMGGVAVSSGGETEEQTQRLAENVLRKLSLWSGLAVHVAQVGMSRLPDSGDVSSDKTHALIRTAKALHPEMRLEGELLWERLLSTILDGDATPEGQSLAPAEQTRSVLTCVLRGLVRLPTCSLSTILDSVLYDDASMEYDYTPLTSASKSCPALAHALLDLEGQECVDVDVFDEHDASALHNAVWSQLDLGLIRRLTERSSSKTLNATCPRDAESSVPFGTPLEIALRSLRELVNSEYSAGAAMFACDTVRILMSAAREDGKGLQIADVWARVPYKTVGASPEAKLLRCLHLTEAKYAGLNAVQAPIRFAAAQVCLSKLRHLVNDFQLAIDRMQTHRTHIDLTVTLLLQRFMEVSAIAPSIVAYILPPKRVRPPAYVPK
jgi:hypothetical protein